MLHIFMYVFMFSRNKITGHVCKKCACMQKYGNTIRNFCICWQSADLYILAGNPGDAHLHVMAVWLNLFEAEFLDKIETNAQEFPPCYSQSPLQLCLDFYFFKLMQPLAVSSVRLLYTVKEKRGKPDRKSHPLPYGLRNPHINLKSENSQYSQKPQRNCTFMNSAFGLISTNW